jgi:YndJ-like protein
MREHIDIADSGCIVILVSNKLLAASSSASRLLLVGLIIWVAALAILPAPLAARILLLAPLVVVPRLLALLPARRWIDRLAGWPALLSALPLLAAFALSPGPTAALFVVPWLVVAVVGALAAVHHDLANLPSIFQPRRFADLGIDVALGFWAVGAIFTLIDRLGLDTGFSTTIVLLTATHFHFAGFGLLGLASLLAGSRPLLRAPVAGLIVGIPLTALGFVLVSDAINAVGALFVGLSGIGVGVGLLTVGGTGVSRWAATVAGVAMLIGMPMGIAWSMAILVGASFLDLDTMIRTHGALNATAVLLGVAAYRSESP